MSSFAAEPAPAATTRVDNMLPIGSDLLEEAEDGFRTGADTYVLRPAVIEWCNATLSAGWQVGSHREDWGAISTGDGDQSRMHMEMRRAVIRFESDSDMIVFMLRWL